MYTFLYYIIYNGFKKFIGVKWIFMFIFVIIIKIKDIYFDIFSDKIFFEGFFRWYV